MEVTVEPTSPNIKMTVESKETDTKMSEEHDKSGNDWGDRSRKCRNRQKVLK